MPQRRRSVRAGSLQTITWTTVGTIANVVIEYSTDNGSLGRGDPGQQKAIRVSMSGGRPMSIRRNAWCGVVGVGFVADVSDALATRAR